jgi:hypothetical protein
MRRLPSVADVGLAQLGIVPEIGQALPRRPDRARQDRSRPVTSVMAGLEEAWGAPLRLRRRRFVSI